QHRLDLHDPPQLPQPLDVLLAAQRGGHTGEVGNRRDVGAQSVPDVLPGRVPAQIDVAAPRPRRLRHHPHLPQPGTQIEHPLPPGARNWTPRPPRTLSGPPVSCAPPARPAPSSSSARPSCPTSPPRRTDEHTPTPSVSSSVPRIPRANPPITTNST